MLTHLTIENYALIEKLEICFEEGLSIITGETGAGKSILLGALGLVLGERADNQVLKNADKNKCIIEAQFSINNPQLKDFFDENQLDFESECIVRREILFNGKSRSFINDTPVNINQLKGLSNLLIDIHSQHETLLLNENNYQLNLLDEIAGNQDLLIDYVRTFKEWKQLSEMLNAAVDEENKAISEKDFIEFQLNELVQANIQAGEEIEIENELQQLKHAEELKSKLMYCSSALLINENAILQSLKDVRQTIASVQKYHPDANQWIDRIQSGMIDLQDLAQEIESKAENLIFDAEKISILTSRLDQIHFLISKHRVTSSIELLEIKAHYQEKLNRFESLSEQIKELENQLQKKHNQLIQLGNLLTQKRTEAGKIMQERVLEKLHRLGMPEAQFSVNISPLQHYTLRGFDKVEYLFNANRGGVPAEISKIASGGELSRLMLAIKSLQVSKNLLSTIIFDEIDMGVSGFIAGKVADILNEMSNTMQVIVITHLPQIASKGKAHYKVFKKVTGDKTITNIIKLNEEERINEIASMLSHSSVTETSIKAAKELLKN